MKQTRSIMGMPITIEIRNQKLGIRSTDFDEVYNYFHYVDDNYSPFKSTSEVGKLNRGENISKEMKEILRLSEELKKQTDGYFDIRRPDGKIDPSGIVKGWAIHNASHILKNVGMTNFYIDAGGDAEIVGKNWKWGIRNPFNVKEIVKVLNLSDCGIATSGIYERGKHIYSPITKSYEISDIVSLTVIGPNVYEADKFSTPAFAMGREGISFIEKQKNCLPAGRDLEGYMIDKDGIATYTSGFNKYAI